MKRFFFIFFTLFFFPAKDTFGQLSFEIMFGSQSTFPTDKEKVQMQFYSVAPAARINIAEFISLKFCYRYGFKTIADFPCEFSNFSNSGISILRGDLKGQVFQRGVIFGVSFSGEPSDSRTRPYMFVDFYNRLTTIDFDDSNADEASLLAYGYDGNIAGRTISLEHTQIVFGAGFQFTMTNSLLFSAESSIGFTNLGTLGHLQYCIDLGLRYYVPFKKKGIK